jgi:hypothetical protein
MSGVAEGSSCALCEGLQREYESALLALARAESQLQIAGFARDVNARKRLENEVEVRAVHRHVLRTKLLDHEASPHNDGTQQAWAGA